MFRFSRYVAVVVVLWCLGVASQAFASCGTPKNAIEAENCLPGTPQSTWDITGAGDQSIQGFATDISYNKGATVSFKINTPASAYTIDIYRMGYYGGNGARKVASITPSASLPQTQPACITDVATKLYDCGNWAVSASWTIPTTSTSGIYFAKLTRTDTGGSSHIVFIVRDDASHSNLLFQASDTGWQAYNDYGLGSLYGTNTTNFDQPNRAYKVSYNRPFHTRVMENGVSWLFYSEYPMVRWLEANGYDVTYFTDTDSDRSGSLILQHKAFLSVGHDEYWSGNQRANVEAARAAGVNLAFFSGNEIFWKTRWENSIDGSNTPNRTLVCYKETHANAVIDPHDPPTWTGTWRDPRFSLPADGGRPENALSGTIFMINGPEIPPLSIQVPAADGKMRFWRNTSVATQSAGNTVVFPAGSLGYEWDIDADNGARPAGLFDLSTATYNINNDYLLDYGTNYGTSTATHHLTMYRAPSGALVFGAGTVQWSWGLDATHDAPDYPGFPADVRMQQATVNLFADMGVQPATLQTGLVAATASTDTTPPTSTITFPTSTTSIQAGTMITIAGTATDVGGLVGGVEVSVDGGTTWHPASGRASWTYNWTPGTTGAATIKSRAVDDSANLETPSAGVSISVTPHTCPCSVWSTSITPSAVDSNDGTAGEYGFRFRSDQSGFITGLRFYKAATNTGTHVAHLWSNTGALMATATFTGESSSGWQQVSFTSPVAILANTTYVASYFAPVGHYSYDPGFFATAGVDNVPLHALQDGVDGANGIYNYGTTSAFPASTFGSSNYWVDVIFTTTGGASGPSVTTVSPVPGAGSVNVASSVSATFNVALNASTVTSSTFQLFDSLNNLVPATVTYNSSTLTATLVPTTALNYLTVYTATVVGGSSGVKDTSGNPMAANVSWTFTTQTAPQTGQCPCTVWSSTTLPGVIDGGDGTAGEYGFRFRADANGFIAGIRFYKATANTGTHTAHLWSNTGSLLASATFSGESSSGWQQVNFQSPVPITANTTYVASYFAPNGHYSFTSGGFNSGVDNSPLHALANGIDGANGVYRYSTTSVFPTSTFGSSNYWVDVSYLLGTSSTTPSVVSTNPASGATGASLVGPFTATFNEAVDPTTINGSTFQLLDASNAVVPATVSYNSSTLTASLAPSSILTSQATYTAIVKGGASGVKDLSGNTMAADKSWTFTTGTVPASQGPGGPILVISSVSNPFSRYYGEILAAEGFNEYTVADISTITATTLASYDIAILGNFPLTSSQVSMITTWVNGGGKLIAMRPDPQLAGLLGISGGTSAISDAYLLVNTASGPGVGITGQTMQFHSAADQYTLNGASSFATLFSNASTATTFPAVTLANAGSGQAAAFTFDLARSVVYTRQGNPAWSAQQRDGLTQTRPDDLFFGAASFDTQPDWVNLSKVSIPQADEQQRLLANLILQMEASKKPLPRFWYFPSGFKAVVVMTGDDHGNFSSASNTIQRFNDFIADSPANCSVADWQCVRETAYLFPQQLASIPLTDAEAASYVAQGFEVSVHVDSLPTDCTNWTPASLESSYSQLMASFAAQFPSVPAPQTHRMHCVTWSDYDTQPQTELRHGIRLDTTYYYYPPTWVNNQPGFMTGSGMPMRFTDRNGNLLDIYQAATQMTDESGQTYPFNIDTLLNNALGSTGYYGAFVANMHNDGVYPGPGANQIVSSAQTHGVPVVSSLQMLQWLDGRNTSSFGSLTWSGGVLSFTITSGTGARNLQAMLPSNTTLGPLVSLTQNGSPVAFTVQTIKGVSYALFNATTGSYQASYVNNATVSSLAVAPISVQGGTSSTGTVTLSAPAPAGGASVTLSSNNAAAQVPASVIVASGATTANFTATTSAVASATPVTFTSSYNSSSNTGVLTVNPASLSLLALSPTSVISGGSSVATVTLSGPAPAGGSIVTLSSSNTSAASVPATVIVPANASTVTFTVTTATVATSTGVTISAVYSGVTKTATLTVTPPTTVTLSLVSLNPTSVIGGTSSTGTITLSGAAPTGGAIVTLSSSNTAAAQVPASVTVAAGATTATFTVSTSPVASTATITVTGSYNSSTKTATLTVNPSALSSVTLNPASVGGGSSSTGTVTLTGPAPTGGAAVTLSSNNTAVAQVPASVTVAANAATATFTVTTSLVSSSTSVTISAIRSGVTKTSTLTVTPGTISVGEQTIESSQDSNPNGQAEAFPFTASSSGNVTTLGVYLDSASTVGKVVVGLYANNGTHPGTLLTQGSITVPKAGTWNTVTVSSAAITSGQTYWIAVMGTTSGTIFFRDRVNGPCHSESSSQTTLTSLLTMWTTGSVYTDCPVSAFGQ